MNSAAALAGKDGGKILPKTVKNATGKRLSTLESARTGEDGTNEGHKGMMFQNSSASI